MKTLIRIALLIFAVWLINHPNTKALLKGLSSVTVEKAQSDFRAETEKQAKAQEQARMKQIDAALEKMDHGNSK